MYSVKKTKECECGCGISVGWSVVGCGYEMCRGATQNDALLIARVLNDYPTRNDKTLKDLIGQRIAAVTFEGGSFSLVFASNRKGRC